MLANDRSSLVAKGDSDGREFNSRARGVFDALFRELAGGADGNGGCSVSLDTELRVYASVAGSGVRKSLGVAAALLVTSESSVLSPKPRFLEPSPLTSFLTLAEGIVPSGAIPSNTPNLSMFKCG